MLRKFMTVLAVSAFALTTLVPVEASAQRYRGHRGDYGDAYGCRNDNNYGCERDRDRRLARNGYDRGYGYGDRYGDDYYHRGECYDRRGRNHCYDRDDDNDDAVAAGVIGLVLGAVLATAVSNSNNQDRGYDDRDYNRGYDNQRYAPPPPPEPQCTRRERQWDRYANRYVTVDVPC